MHYPVHCIVPNKLNELWLKIVSFKADGQNYCTKQSKNFYIIGLTKYTRLHQVMNKIFLNLCTR